MVDAFADFFLVRRKRRENHTTAKIMPKVGYFWNSKTSAITMNANPICLKILI
ncbi:hypothetical protein [Candidatus Lokiarchaeum ossiferum]|uniref:hypothetical protein n=1 Tax=Candidatus Lokiarchaeum ossiferum TaxID=2951803 RepID=UPI00352F0D33